MFFRSGLIEREPDHRPRVDRLHLQLLRYQGFCGPYAGTAVLNAAGEIQNSQCVVNWGSSPVNGNGNNLSLALSIAFTAAFDGNRVFYLAARDGNGGNNTDWQAVGSVAIP